jgi:hypothetical protein
MSSLRLSTSLGMWTPREELLLALFEREISYAIPIEDQRWFGFEMDEEKYFSLSMQLLNWAKTYCLMMSSLAKLNF